MTTSYTIEAEHMYRTGGFAKVHGDQASNGSLVKLACGHEGTLSKTFEEDSGKFDLTVHAQDEWDGVSVIDVYVDGQKVGEIKLDDPDAAQQGSDDGYFNAFTLPGIQIDTGAKIELRAERDGCEYVRIDKITLESSPPDPVPEPGCEPVTETLIHEDFDKICDPDDSDAIVYDGGWDVRHDMLRTSGGNDGLLKFAKVDVAQYDSADLTFKIGTPNVAVFERADYLRVEVRVINEDGTAQTVVLDEFRLLNDHGTEFVGSVTGKTFSESLTELSYGLDDLPEGTAKLELRLVSSISSCYEKIYIDDVKLTGTTEADCVDCPDDYIKLSFDDLPAGTIVSDQYEGIKISAIANGGNKLVIQAEDFDTITGGAIRSGNRASDGKFVKLGSDGEIATDFSGGDGSYKIAVRIQDEKDGAGTVEVFVGGQSVGTFVVEGKEGGSGNTRGSDNGRFSTFTLDGLIEIDNGQEVKIVYSNGGGELGRIDKVTFIAPDDANRAMIFDSDNPTGGDNDLGVDQGGVLIISEDLDSTDPDDEAHGGAICIEFENGADLASIDAIDTEEGGVFIAYDKDGNEIGRVDIPEIPDGAVQTVDLNLDGVYKLIVELNGSGAIDDLCFKPGPDDVPDPLGSLGDRVWFDLDKDGVQDAGETGVNGVTVRLLDGNGDQLATQVTAGDGNYLFTDLDAGDYEVVFDQTTLPAGYEFTTQDQGPDDNVDSDADQTTGSSGIVTLAQGENRTDVDAGIVDPGTASVAGVYFCDENGNNIEDAGDKRVSGVEVELLDSAGNVLLSTTTNGNGEYLFDGLDAGTYSVRFPTEAAGGVLVDQDQGGDDTIDSDADTTTGETAQFTLAIGDTKTDVDAGVKGTSSLGDTVWIDANRDGINNDTFNALAVGVAVSLLDADMNVIDTTVTNDQGQYLFDGLKGGDYIVQFGDIAGYGFTAQGDGTQPIVDSDANTTDGKSDVVTLGINEVNLDIDAGYIRNNTEPRSLQIEICVCADDFLEAAGNVNLVAVGGEPDPDGDTVVVSEINGIDFVPGSEIDFGNGIKVTIAEDGSLDFGGTAASVLRDLAVDETLEFSLTFKLSDGIDESNESTFDIKIFGALDTIEELCASLPDEVQYEVKAGTAANPITDIAFDIDITGSGDPRLDDAVFTEAYCLSYFEFVPGESEFDGQDLLNGSLYCGQDVPASVFDDVGGSNAAGASANAFENLDLINWILNQDYKGQGFTDYEIQVAIWELTSSDDPQFGGKSVVEVLEDDFQFLSGNNLGTKANVETIVAEAIANGEGFEAGLGDIVGLVIDPEGLDPQNNVQPFIIGYQFDAECPDFIC